MTSLIITPADKHEYILLKEMLEKMKINFKPLEYDIDDSNEDEEWYRFAMMNFARTYSDDEPEYTSDMIKEPNPDYDPNFHFNK
ncbi:MAG: hypothetical protein A2X61_11230 [Ignavibacteria bacterium GWB2_35_12]|nr:MAG: hypothetical protein A2X61_11230 [Ignavibacteria bacterium GWB2_35_12]OGU89751.1 MAG: hypothetical protein A2220_02795 [Ignavibacteria bacterium RIFOXYA2_FULL_35_10]OGV24008.1 MAG: hypothetical protein A2475_10875 [Ignavibacteria bacterium RIFOXYC2_FULL_35_21]